MNLSRVTQLFSRGKGRGPMYLSLILGLLDSRGRSDQELGGGAGAVCASVEMWRFVNCSSFRQDLRWGDHRDLPSAEHDDSPQARSVLIPHLNCCRPLGLSSL